MKAIILVLSLLLITACTSTAEPSATPISVTIQDTIAPPTAEVTLEVTAEASQELSTLIAPNPTLVASGNTPQEAVIAANVDEADIESGEQLYNQTLIPLCSSCHLVDATVRQIAPSLTNFRDIAGTRVEGQDAYTYAYNSIRYADQHVVEGYSAGVMRVYDGILNDQDVYDLIAYIWTLSD